jgi:hypothetical protein
MVTIVRNVDSVSTRAVSKIETCAHHDFVERLTAIEIYLKPLSWSLR